MQIRLFLRIVAGVCRVRKFRDAIGAIGFSEGVNAHVDVVDDTGMAMFLMCDVCWGTDRRVLGGNGGVGRVRHSGAERRGFRWGFMR